MDRSRPSPRTAWCSRRTCTTRCRSSSNVKFPNASAPPTAAVNHTRPTERAEVMIAHRILVPSRRFAAAAAMALAGSMMVSAATAPVKLVGVSSQDNAVLIESTEPVAYAVSRPDPLTLIVDLRNVSVADARATVARAGALASVKLEQAAAVDGASLARVRMSLSRPSEYQVRSARNTIRVELTPAAAKGTTAATPAPAAQTALSSPLADPGPATLLERVRARRAD